MTDFAYQDDVRPTSTPVVKRQRIGDRFVGAFVRYEQRDVLKRDEETGENRKVLKPNGKPRQELVVHCLAMPDTTSPAGLGDTTGIPEPGTPVRLILRGGAFGDWIDARKAHRGGAIQFGDIVTQTVEFAQAWNADGTAKGPKITDQAVADAIPRNTAVGFYGPLTLAPWTDIEWARRCKAAKEQAEAASFNADDDSDAPF